MRINTSLGPTPKGIFQSCWEIIAVFEERDNPSNLAKLLCVDIPCRIFHSPIIHSNDKRDLHNIFKNPESEDNLGKLPLE